MIEDVTFRTIEEDYRPHSIDPSWRHPAIAKEALEYLNTLRKTHNVQVQISYCERVIKNG